jgi:hypothetical protein
MIVATFALMAATFFGSVGFLTFFGQAWVERRRRRRATQAPEAIWRELLAGRALATPLLAIVGAWWLAIAILLQEPGNNSAIPFYFVAASFFLNAAQMAWEVSRALRLGWADGQEAELARRAHRLATEGAAFVADKARAGSAS